MTGSTAGHDGRKCTVPHVCSPTVCATTKKQMCQPMIRRTFSIQNNAWIFRLRKRKMLYRPDEATTNNSAIRGQVANR